MVSYATVEQLASRIQLLEGLTESVTEVLTELIEAMSRKVDRFCRVEDGFFLADLEPSVRYFMGTGKSYMYIDHCVEIHSGAMKPYTHSTEFETLDETTYSAAYGSAEQPDFNKRPLHILFRTTPGLVFTKASVFPTVRVVANWGWSYEVPEDICEATLAQAAVIYKRFQGSMSSNLANADLGEFKTTYRRSELARDVKELLADGTWVLPMYAGNL